MLVNVGSLRGVITLCGTALTLGMSDSCHQLAFTLISGHSASQMHDEEVVFTLTQRPRKPRSDGRATRAAILRAAQELFVEHGYEQTTVRSIAERAGCNLALISRYFGGKGALFETVLRQGPVAEAVKYSLLDHPVRSWGHALVRLQLRITGEADREAMHDQVLMLFRSAATKAGGRRLTDFLTREYSRVIPTPAGPDAELRSLLVQALMVGLTVLRDIARLPQLCDAEPETIVRYLGPAIQQLLHPRPASRTR